jgi:nitric oxide reductase activation protein
VEKRGVTLEEPEETEEEMAFEEMERIGTLEIPKIQEFEEKAKFVGEGSYNIPNLGIAIEIGDEISSELKRELKLKKSLVKKKTSGRIDMKRVRKQFSYYGEIRDTDIFMRGKKLLPEHSVLVLIDFSGSMAGHKLINAKQAFATFARTLSQLRVPFSLRGYCAKHGYNIIGDVEIKGFDKEECNYTVINRAYYPTEPGNWCENRDGDSWRYGAGILTQQKGDKLLIVISDGQPHHGGTTYSGHLAYKDSELAIEQIENMGIKTIGISIDRAANDYIDKVFKNSFFFDGDKLHMLGAGLTEIYLKAMKFE